MIRKLPRSKRRVLQSRFKEREVRMRLLWSREILAQENHMNYRHETIGRSNCRHIGLNQPSTWTFWDLMANFLTSAHYRIPRCSRTQHMVPCLRRHRRNTAEIPFPGRSYFTPRLSTKVSLFVC